MNIDALSSQEFTHFYAQIGRYSNTAYFLEKYDFSIPAVNGFDDRNFEYLEGFFSCKIAKDIFEIILRHLKSKKTSLEITFFYEDRNLSSKEERGEASLKGKKIKVDLFDLKYQNPSYRTLIGVLKKTLTNIGEEPFNGRDLYQMCKSSWNRA